MASHGEFGNPGQKPGVEIWRIEKMVPTAVAEADHGTFYTGDSYIILHTKQASTALDYDLHFWLGSETSQDEAGACAYKTVELDDFLGGRPIQYREVQDHESAMFLSIFGGSVRYLSGGVDSAFNKVDPDAYEPRLLHCKGRRKVRCNQVPITHKSMNHGDVFVLDAGLRIYQWNGKDASRMEKAKALEMVTHIRDAERGGKAVVKIINDGAADNDAADVAEFWEEMGGEGPIAEDGGDDDAHEAAGNAEVVLYQVSDAGGSMSVNEVGRMPLSRDLLDSDDAFILDCGSEIFVWIGKGANKDERRNAMAHAQEFLVNMGRPDWTPITRLPESGETPLFKEKFSDWHAKEQAAMFDFSGAGSSNIAKVEDKGVDVGAMHTRAAAYEEEEVDDGSGTLQIWRIENFEKVPLDESVHGQFYNGDSYIILYTYDDAQGREAWIIYYWIGSKSSQDEVGAAALLTKDLDDSLGGGAVQVRVTQGKEPNHFLVLFKGKMIVHEGGCASGFSNANDVDSYDTDGISLFHVRGTTPKNTRATQVEEVAASLNSNDVFVLETPGVQYVWLGNGASEDEKTYGQAIAEVLKHNRSLELVNEGSEPDAFWEAIGGKGEYANFPHLKDVPSEPRLFQCSNATGAFTVEEIYCFAQVDLDNDDVMILDTFVEVYVWVGADCNAEEKKRAMETAVDYVRHATDGRDEDTPILLVHSGAEPPMFTCHFLGWDPSLTAGDEAYQAKLAEMKAAAAESGGAPGGDVRATLDSYNRDYTYEELTARPAPEGVDPTKLETYLSDADFQEVFGIPRSEYDSLANWKKVNLKKKFKLF